MEVSLTIFILYTPYHNSYKISSTLNFTVKEIMFQTEEDHASEELLAKLEEFIRYNDSKQWSFTRSTISYIDYYHIPLAYG